MKQVEAPGWNADWINGWLAAVGIVSLCGEAKLTWSSDARPHAIFTGINIDDMVEAWPTVDELSNLGIAEDHASLDGEFPRNPSRDQYNERADFCRKNDDYSLGATLSDLVKLDESLAHAPFSPAAPGSTGPLYRRMLRCHEKVAESESAIAASLTGACERVPVGGLGFDPRRIMYAAVAKQPQRVDPVVEVFAFFGLQIFNVRGSRTRGWTSRILAAGSFRWPTWTEPLDFFALDALLDVFYNSDIRWPFKSPTYSTVPYQPLTGADQTRAYDSQLHGD